MEINPDQAHLTAKSFFPGVPILPKSHLSDRTVFWRALSPFRRTDYLQPM